VRGLREERCALRRANSFRLLFVSFSPSVLSARWQSGIWQHGQSLVRRAALVVSTGAAFLWLHAAHKRHTHTHTFTLGSRTLRRGAKKAIERLEVTRRSGGPPELSLIVHVTASNNIFTDIGTITLNFLLPPAALRLQGREAQRGGEACVRVTHTPCRAPSAGTPQKVDRLNLLFLLREAGLRSSDPISVTTGPAVKIKVQIRSRVPLVVGTGFICLSPGWTGEEQKMLLRGAAGQQLVQFGI